MALGRDSNAWDYADSTTPDLTDFPNESEGVCCLQSLDGSEEFPKVILELQPAAIELVLFLFRL